MENVYILRRVGDKPQIDSSDPARKPPARAEWAYMWLQQGVSMEAIAGATGARVGDVQRTVRGQLSAGPLPVIRRMGRAA
jgi:hypothetical protein